MKNSAGWLPQIQGFRCLLWPCHSIAQVPMDAGSQRWRSGLVRCSDSHWEYLQISGNKSNEYRTLAWVIPVTSTKKTTFMDGILLYNPIEITMGTKDLDPGWTWAKNMYQKMEKDPDTAALVLRPSIMVIRETQWPTLLGCFYIISNRAMPKNKPNWRYLIISHSNLMLYHSLVCHSSLKYNVLCWCKSESSAHCVLSILLPGWLTSAGTKLQDGAPVRVRVQLPYGCGWILLVW